MSVRPDAHLQSVAAATLIFNAMAVTDSVISLVEPDSSDSALKVT
jgi:hypothetical protein